jgi:hypothetical protein
VREGREGEGPVLVRRRPAAGARAPGCCCGRRPPSPTTARRPRPRWRGALRPRSAPGMGAVLPRPPRELREPELPGSPELGSRRSAARAGWQPSELWRLRGEAYAQDTEAGLSRSAVKVDAERQLGPVTALAGVGAVASEGAGTPQASATMLTAGLRAKPGKRWTAELLRQQALGEPDVPGIPGPHLPRLSGSTSTSGTGSRSAGVGVGGTLRQPRPHGAGTGQPDERAHAGPRALHARGGGGRRVAPLVRRDRDAVAAVGRDQRHRQPLPRGHAAGRSLRRLHRPSPRAGSGAWGAPSPPPATSCAWARWSAGTWPRSPPAIACAIPGRSFASERLFATDPKDGGASHRIEGRLGAAWRPASGPWQLLARVDHALGSGTPRLGGRHPSRRRPLGAALLGGTGEAPPSTTSGPAGLGTVPPRVVPAVLRDATALSVAAGFRPRAGHRVAGTLVFRHVDSDPFAGIPER